jgi:uncharacterized protein
MTPPLVKDTRQGARFLVRLTPRARKTALLGLLVDGPDALLRIAVQSPPIEGRANAALVEFLSGLLGVPRSAIEIAAGEHARNKVILVRGPTAAQISARIEAAREE